MDEELRQYLVGMEARMDNKLADMETRMDGKFAGMEARMDSKLADMETRMDGKFADMETRMDGKVEGRIDAAFTRFSQHILHEMEARFDEVKTKLESIDTRLKLQVGLIQSGARAMARFSEFSETSEQRWVALALRVQALEHKVEGLGGTAKT